MLLRLVRLGEGALLTQPVERGLDDWYRFMFPGRETAKNHSFNHGDGSGDGWYMMNDDTGEEIQVLFTPEQKKAFNAFKESASITIDNVELLPPCLGTPVLAPTLAKLKEDEGNPLTMIIEMEDNSVAQANINSRKNG